MMWTSLFGIVTLVLLARALGFAKAPGLADADAAMRIAGEALPDFDPGEAVIAGDGRSALVAGRDGRVALVRPFGDRWVVRIVNGAGAEARGDRLRLRLAEAMFAPVELQLGSAAVADHWARAL